MWEKQLWRKSPQPSSYHWSSSLAYILYLSSILRKKKKKTRAFVEKMACREVCVQYTWTQFSPLPMSYLTWFFCLWGFAVERPVTWERVNDSEHQLLLNNLLAPTWSHFFSIPRYQQSQLTHTNAQGTERHSFPSHLAISFVECLLGFSGFVLFKSRGGRGCNFTILIQ